MLHIKIIDVQYLVIDSRTPYHMKLGKPSLNALGVMVSMLHLTLKFPVSAIKIGVVYAN